MMTEITGSSMPMDRVITIPPGDGSLLTFSRHGFSAILLYLPDDVRPYFRIDKIQIGDWAVPDPLAGQLIEVDIQIGAWTDVIVRLTNVSDRSRDLHAILWTKYQNGRLEGDAIGWDDEGGMMRFASWLGSDMIFGSARTGQPN
jgi:hypothetical protein